MGGRSVVRATRSGVHEQGALARNNLQACVRKHARLGRRWSPWTIAAASARHETELLAEAGILELLDLLESLITPIVVRELGLVGVSRTVDPGSCIRMKLPE